MNVLIVDDQVDVVQGILSGVDWPSVGIRQAFPSYSAAEAQTVLQTNHVDILLCDIEMPEKSGLEFFRWVREHYSGIECIFLTAHAEFEYAREALELGSFGYILQPARYEEISAMVAKAAAKLRQSESEKQVLAYGAYWRDKKETLLDNCMRSFVTGAEEDTGRFLADLASLGYTLSANAAVTPLLIRLSPGGKDAGLPDELTVSLHRQGAILAGLDAQEFFALAPAHQPIPWSAEQLAEHGIACYVGHDVPVSGIRESYAALVSLCRNNVADYTGVFFLEESGAAATDFVPLPDMEHWARLLASGGADTVRAQAHRYLEEQKKQGTMNTELLARFHQDFVQMLLAIVRDMGLGARDALFGERFDEYLQAYTSLDDMHRFVDHALVYIGSSAVTEGDEPPPVTRAVEYINQNIEKNLGRSEIAEAVYLNPEYLSRLFKKEMGVSLVDFIVQRKMEIAQSLLTGTAIPVYLIASKVGYSNFSYFSKVFKKHSGLTPQEYRTQNGKRS